MNSNIIKDKIIKPYENKSALHTRCCILAYECAPLVQLLTQNKQSNKSTLIFG